MLIARSLLLAVPAVSAAGLVATGSSSEGSSRASCHPRGANVVAENARVQVYRRGEILYGCVRDRGRRSRHELSEGTDAFPYPSVSLRGTLTGFAQDVYEGTSTFTEVKVRDVRRTRGPSKLLIRSPSFVAKVALVDARTVAWVVCLGGTTASTEPPRCRDTEPNTIQILKHDRGTPAARYDVVAESEAIKVRSVRVAGRRISWREGDRRRSARLR